MTIRQSLYAIAALLFTLSEDSQFWSDALGYRQAGERVLAMARGFVVD